MNDQTQKLLEQLAQKLGTTADHLWSVLITQARLNAWVTIAQLATFAVMLWIARKVMPPMLAKVGPNGDEEDAQMRVTIFWAVWYGLAIIGCWIAVDSINEVTQGFLNPEYWAIHQIIK